MKISLPGAEILLFYDSRIGIGSSTSQIYRVMSRGREKVDDIDTTRNKVKS